MLCNTRGGLCLIAACYLILLARTRLAGLLVITFSYGAALTTITDIIVTFCLLYLQCIGANEGNKVFKLPVCC